MRQFAAKRGYQLDSIARQTKVADLKQFDLLITMDAENIENMRALDKGESFLVTRNGAPVGELRPVRRRQFVRASQILAAFANAAPLDAGRFRRDIDKVLDQDPTPRV